MKAASSWTLLIATALLSSCPAVHAFSNVKGFTDQMLSPLMMSSVLDDNTNTNTGSSSEDNGSDDWPMDLYENENSFIKMKCLKHETLQNGAAHGQFVIHSLRSGQGITIGNQLRRVMLGDLGGIAISAIRIAGVSHEFSTIPGVREDILEILLNLKGVVFKTKSKEPQFGRLKVQGPCVVTADNIIIPQTQLDCVNKNHYIATISSSNVLEIEFRFEYGAGYKLASKVLHARKSADAIAADDDEHFLPLDCVFMPVTKVDFKVENVYDRQDNVVERLFLDVWTNGSLSPQNAMELASKYMIDFYTSLIDNNRNEISGIDDSDAANAADAAGQLAKTDRSVNIEPYTNIAIEELQLSVRAYNCLKKANINTIGDLLKYTPEKLQTLKNFGRKSADEVFQTLKDKLGIVLK